MLMYFYVPHRNNLPVVIFPLQV